MRALDFVEIIYGLLLIISGLVLLDEYVTRTHLPPTPVEEATYAEPYLQYKDR